MFMNFKVIWHVCVFMGHFRRCFNIDWHIEVTIRGGGGGGGCAR